MGDLVDNVIQSLLIARWPMSSLHYMSINDCHFSKCKQTADFLKRNIYISGDDLSRINAKGFLFGLSKLQKSDGSFMASLEEKCCDMRFVYCAASICTFLNSFEGIDTISMTDYILKSLTYEGAFGQGPGLEAHGGSTYCAVASLVMLGTWPMPSLHS